MLASEYAAALAALIEEHGGDFEMWIPADEEGNGYHKMYGPTLEYLPKMYVGKNWSDEMDSRDDIVDQMTHDLDSYEIEEQFGVPQDQQEMWEPTDEQVDAYTRENYVRVVVS